MSSTRRRKVLITGAAGVIGSILREGLSGEYDLSGLDRRRIAGFDARKGDTRKLRHVKRASVGKDVVVDLASRAAVSTSWKDVYRNNVPATLNALEAARESGAQRVVFASSNHVVGMYERDEPYVSIVAGRYEGLDPARIPRLTAESPIRPDSAYAVGKALGEAAGRYYSEQFGLSVICLRIGSVTQQSGPTETRSFATLLSHRDLVQLVQACIEAPPELRFGIYYGVSANTWRFWDIEAAREQLGYEPQDDAEHWRASFKELASSPEENHP